jgi:pyruvate,water dikinase
VGSTTVWSRRIADELWSGTVTPLTFSLLAREIEENMARRRLLHAGLSAASNQPVFRLFRGHVYVNASLIADVMKELPSIFLSEGLLGILPVELRGEVRSGGRSLLAPQTVQTVLHLTWRETRWMPWSRGELFRSEATRIARAFEGPPLLADESLDRLLAEIEGVCTALGRYLEIVSWGMIYAYVFFHLTAHLVERWAPDEGISLVDLTAGIPGIRTFEVHDELLACARLADRDPELRRALLENEPAAIAASCARGELGALGARIIDVLDRHGHRLVARDLSAPTWRERPTVVVEMLQKLLRAGSFAERGARTLEFEARLRKTAERIDRGVAGSLRRELFVRCVRWCREYYGVRENMRYYADVFLARLRALSLACGRRLGERGCLERPEDIFFLTTEELRAAAQEPRDAAFGLRAAARRAEYAAYESTPPPEVVRGDESGALLVPDASNAVARDPAARNEPLRGLGASPGCASGQARVIFGANDLRTLLPGEVIVATATEPSWTPFVGLGGALVLEVGGLLSHGAIVARELGIPAVVDVAAATRLLMTGERLTVDGGTGVVTPI